MGKLDELMKAHGANISDSFGTAPAADGLPPGMSLAQVTKAVHSSTNASSSPGFTIQLPLVYVSAMRGL